MKKNLEKFAENLSIEEQDLFEERVSNYDANENTKHKNRIISRWLKSFRRELMGRGGYRSKVKFAKAIPATTIIPRVKVVKPHKPRIPRKQKKRNFK